MPKPRSAALQAKVAAAKKTIKRVNTTRRRLNSYKSSIKSSGLLSSPSPFPLVWKAAKQVYGDISELTVGSTGTYGAPSIYALNDMFDTRFSTGGHQPYARDEFFLLYARYKVVAVTVEVIFTSPSIAGVSCGMIFRNPTQATTIAAKSIPYIREIPVATQKIISDTGSQRYVFKKYFPMHKILGVTKLQFDADIGIYDALSSGSPDATAGLAKLEVAVADSNGGSSATCVASVQITMHTNWYQRKILAQS